MADNETKPTTIAEEAGLDPARWIPADVPPIIPGRMLPGVPVSRTPTNLQGSLPPDFQHDTSFVATEYDSPNVPKFSIMPLGIQGTSMTNAAIQSSSTKNPVLASTRTQTQQNTTAIAEQQQTGWQGTWDAIIPYVSGAIVEYIGVIYVSLVGNNLNNQPDTSPTDWQATGQVQFFGAWSNSVTYNNGALVDYLGVIYISIQNTNLNHTPDSSPTWWTATGTESFLGAWDNATAYTTGQTVTDGGGLYIALQNSTNKQPSTTSGYWQLLTNSTVFSGAWSSSTQYSIGSEVSYNGAFWVATAANLNQTPAPGSSYWVNVGTSAILLAAYSAGVTYSVGMEAVGTDGNVYSWINTTPGSGHAPPNGTYWQLVGPATLDSVTDGSTKFGQTASGLSYRPTTNPLTAHDAGSNATVSIASFTMRTSSKGDISISSGSVTALSYGTLYYIYYDDSTLAGGGVSFSATTTKTTAINGSGRFYVGSILTPIAGAPDTVGFGDGGVGAQNGGATIYLGGATANTIGSGGSITNPQNAIDGNLTTSATVTDTLASPGTAATSLTISGISPLQILTQATLYVRSSVTVSSGTPTATVAYSLNGGTSFTNIYSTSSNRALQTDSVALPIGQNLALVQIKATAQTQNSGGTSSTTVNFYEGWIEVIV
jgi:hypothetical protein